MKRKMKRKINYKVFLLASLLVSSSMLWSPVTLIRDNVYKIGLPFRYIIFYSREGIPLNRLNLFQVKNMLATDFRIHIYFLDIFIVYIIIKLLIEYLHKNRRGFHYREIE